MLKKFTRVGDNFRDYHRECILIETDLIDVVESHRSYDYVIDGYHHYSRIFLNNKKTYDVWESVDEILNIVSSSGDESNAL